MSVKTSPVVLPCQAMPCLALPRPAEPSRAVPRQYSETNPNVNPRILILFVCSYLLGITHLLNYQS